MLTKRSLIVALVGLNLVLLAGLLLSTDMLPRALAGPGGRPGDFALSTVKVSEDFDGVYIVDQTNRKLHMFVPTNNRDGTLTFLQTRDLESDFRRTQ